MYILNFALVLLLVGLCAAEKGFHEKLGCHFNPTNPSCEVFNAWIDRVCVYACNGLAVKQIQMEFDACCTYLDIANHFAGDDGDRPGVGCFFFKAARLECEHGAKLMDHLSFSGQRNNISGVVKAPSIAIRKWNNVADAMQIAVSLEAKIAKAIRNLISACKCQTCECCGGIAPCNFRHFVDFLTGLYLDGRGQLRGQRKLAGMFSKLSKLEELMGRELAINMMDTTFND
ncbi:ferritin subunit-like [Teleopsis dalmanni]|uniref:ferritin subunit-like n=1 Tax=Teleopsis dalmanni TaxID=139649 RepID=UPI0018CEC3A0|nr:ferritin subunit-like [Teleopsis dalmanni]